MVYCKVVKTGCPRSIHNWEINPTLPAMEVLQISIKSGGHPVSDSCNYARTYILTMVGYTGMEPVAAMAKLRRGRVVKLINDGRARDSRPGKIAWSHI